MEHLPMAGGESVSKLRTIRLESPFRGYGYEGGLQFVQ